MRQKRETTWERTARYQAQAETMRQRAEEANNAERARNLLLQAAAYERLAMRADRE